MPIDPPSVAATASAPASVAILHRARREAKFYAGLKCCDEPGFFRPRQKPLKETQNSRFSKLRFYLLRLLTIVILGQGILSKKEGVWIY